MVRFQAFEGRVFEARVTRVLLTQTARRGLEVRLTLDAPVENLRPGMTAEVNVVLARHDGVLAAPVDGVKCHQRCVRVVRWPPRIGRPRCRRSAETSKNAPSGGNGVEHDAVTTAPVHSEGVRVKTTLQPLLTGEPSGAANSPAGM
ncbi:MAG: hypothetical protein U0326_05710 [Polyangiales bacterium]